MSWTLELLWFESSFFQVDIFFVKFKLEANPLNLFRNVSTHFLILKKNVFTITNLTGIKNINILTFNIITLRIASLLMTLSITSFCHGIKCRNADEHCPLFIVILHVIMLNDIGLNVLVLNVIMLNVIMLKVDILNVIRLNVIMLNVIMLNINMLNIILPWR